MNDEITPNKHNVLFITLDSCRWDTFKKAKTPHFDIIGQAFPAQTCGNYTLPAHASFFAAKLPAADAVTNRPYYTRDHPLWRLKKARKTDIKAGLYLKTYSIIDGYRNLGYHILGYGGTLFFYYPNEFLMKYFKEDEFVHFMREQNYPKESFYNYPRPLELSPLCSYQRILQQVNNKENWFIFINETLTHNPFHISKIKNSKTLKLLEHLNSFSSGRIDSEHRYSYETGGYLLHELQVKAVEHADLMFGKLLDALPHNKPIVVVICGDHGESFGENNYWGHLNNSTEVLTVPLLINANYNPE